MTEAISLLLSTCENDTPPFGSVIRTALSSLHQSRFQFALELQQTFDSKKDILTPTQQLCILCAIHDIGNGLGTCVSEWDIAHNVFGEFLLNHQEDVADIVTRISYAGQLPLLQALKLNSTKEKEKDTTRGSSPSCPPCLLLDPCIVDTLEQERSFDIKFHRPLPPFVCNELLQQKQIDWPELNLSFLHTTYPSLRYQWMPSTTLSPSTTSSSSSSQMDDSFDAHVNSNDNHLSSQQSSSSSSSSSVPFYMEGLLQKVFQEPLELEEEATVLKYCQLKGIGISSNQNQTQFVVTLDNLSMIVEHNPNIAFELLLTIQDEQVAAKFHSKLVNMEVTLNTMEVVYKLATTIAVEDGILTEGSLPDAKPKAATRDVSVARKVPCKLHAEYLHVFILGLFERCALSQDRKMVRLVSVFLQNLIQNDIVQVDDLVSAQVQAFCIESSRVREAQVLFKLLKDKSGSGTSHRGMLLDGRMMGGAIGGVGVGGGRDSMTAASSSSKVKNGNDKSRKK